MCRVPGRWARTVVGKDDREKDEVDEQLQGFGFRANGFGFVVLSLGFRVQSSEFLGLG